MNQLSGAQRELVSSLAERLATIHGMKAVVLGGSYARGRAQAGSDIDLGLFYTESDPFQIQSIREIAESVNDTPEPVVTDFYGWGPWVNGGAWLTIGGQRVDFIYRSLEHVERVIADAESGRYEVDYLQQPPFGFFSGTYCGEIAVCVPLCDSEGRIEKLKRLVANYPGPMQLAIVQDYLWQAEFGLAAFARKFAARGDSYGTAACLTRAVNQIVMTLFALNRQYPLNDKTALTEVSEFKCAPQEFTSRVQTVLGRVGANAAELTTAVECIAKLLHETIDLTDGLYQPRFALPG